MFMIEEVTEAKDEKLLDEHDDDQTTTNGTCEISLVAIEGGTNTSTFKVIDHVKNLNFIILIDSSTTHNFIDPSLVARFCGIT